MVTFRVPDMTCGHCASKIAKAVAAADPAARVEFELGDHLVRVSPGSCSGAELMSAIEDAGYSPAAVEAKPAPRASSGCGCGCGTRAALDVRQVNSAAKGGCCG